MRSLFIRLVANPVRKIRSIGWKRSKRVTEAKEKITEDPTVDPFYDPEEYPDFPHEGI